MSATTRSPASASLAARLLIAALAAVLSGAPSASAAESFIDSSHQTSLAFGERSYWLQPWRGYLDTVPGTVMRDAVGVNLNGDATQSARTVQLLAASGVRRARVEFGWNRMSFDDPSRLADPARLEALLRSLRDHGIRPLLLLNAHEGAPGPTRLLDLRVVAPAAAGARTLRLDAASARTVVAGRTGLNALDGSYKAADVLFSRVAADGTVTLSKPLLRSLATGSYRGATLRFAPFQPPQRSDGSANPAFAQTLDGWLRYVAAITGVARSVLGDGRFDVEVWNELSFGSGFLDAGSYYAPAPAGRGSVTDALLARTIAWLRDPSHGVAHVGIGDGFASESPWVSGATVPVGVSALDKHLYAAPRDYPRDAQRNTLAVGTDGEPQAWAPQLRAFFPEYWLSGLQTEHVVRDLSPFTTSVYGIPHGRTTHPPGGAPPQLWITETGVDLADARLAQSQLTAAARRHILTKGALRSLVAYVNKGATVVDLYAARGPVYGVIDEGFFAGGAAGGETIDALRRLTGVFAGAQAPAQRRSLRLLSVQAEQPHVQFAGDGTAAHPPLYNSDVVAFFPFQLGDRRFAIPAYVMTRDVARLYRSSAPSSDVTRWDLPPERYRIAVGGLNPAAGVTAVDPLTGSAVAVGVVERSADRLVLDVPLTDSPRLLLVDDG